MSELRAGTVRAGDIDFSYLEAIPSGGSGPLALCLHGFPDSAGTWRHLLPVLAGDGYRAVAPFMRGYAPTSLAADGDYSAGALVDDVVQLHETLGGEADAVLIGHDWGAVAAYGAAAFEPDRWRRVVTVGVGPMAAAAERMFTLDQLRRQWYVFFLQLPVAEAVIAADDFQFLTDLWHNWAPSYDPRDDLAGVRESLGPPGRLSAALAYYRAYFLPPPPAREKALAALALPTPQTTLYLHGGLDPCSAPIEREQALALLGPESVAVAWPDVGHFPHLERPGATAELIRGFLATA